MTAWRKTVGLLYRHLLTRNWNSDSWRSRYREVKYPNVFLKVPTYFSVHIPSLIWPWANHENFLACTATGTAMHMNSGNIYIKCYKIQPGKRLSPQTQNYFDPCYAASFTNPTKQNYFVSFCPISFLSYAVQSALPCICFPTLAAFPCTFILPHSTALLRFSIFY